MPLPASRDRLGASTRPSGSPRPWSWSGPWRRDPGHVPEAGRPKAGFYPGLDLLRGFAAIWVVVYHVVELWPWSSVPFDNPVALWSHVGWMGVDLFFVISGLVITLSALKLRERDPAGYAKTFVRRRLARIVPLHYLTCAAFVALVMPAIVHAPRFWLHALTHLTFTHNLVPQLAGSINGPNWSLGVEMQFYLLVLLAAAWLARARIAVVLAGSLAIAWAWRGLAFAAAHGRFEGGVNMTWFHCTQLPGALDEFGFGIALALLLHRDTTGRLARFLRTTRWLWPLAAAALLTATMHWFWKDPSFWGDGRMVVFWRTLLGASWVTLIVAAIALDDAWFLKMTAPLRYLGTISYGIYLWHVPVLLLLQPRLAHAPALGCAATLAITLGLASLSWHAFEKPMLNWLGKSRTAPAGGTEEVPAPAPSRRERVG